MGLWWAVFAALSCVVSAQSTVVGWVGSTKLNSEWKTVNFPRTFTNPVLIVQPPETSGRESVVVRIRNVQGTSFEGRLIERDDGNNDEGRHADEDVAYLVVETGRYVFPAGFTIEAGTTRVSEQVPTFTSIVFSEAFTAAPVVLTQAQTTEDEGYVSTRQHEPGRFSFRVSLSKVGGRPGAETVGWIAVTKGEGVLTKENANDADRAWVSGNFLSDPLSDTEGVLNWNPTINNPRVIAWIASFNDPDHVALRQLSDAKSNSGTVLKLQEHELMGEVSPHAAETVHYFVAANDGPLLIPAPPVDGGWGAWQNAGGCSVTCGEGTRPQVRLCNDPPPSEGGQDCTGRNTRDIACSNDPCFTLGGWTEWSPTTGCSTTCGDGILVQTRTCTAPRPVGDGADCVGDDRRVLRCNPQPCPADPVDGEWTPWNQGVCSTTCGDGVRTDTRLCIPPQNGGAPCSGSTSRQRACNNGDCPVGQWSGWNFGQCSQSCGPGMRTDTRVCSGGTPCTGASSRQRACDNGACPVNGGWSAWTSGGACSKTCGRGVRTETRSCSNPRPSGGGDPCSGPSSRNLACNTQDCVGPVDGTWSSWILGRCSVSCGRGIRVDTRRCTPPLNGGAPCEGPSSREERCTAAPCPPPPCLGEQQDAELLDCVSEKCVGLISDDRWMPENGRAICRCVTEMFQCWRRRGDCFTADRCYPRLMDAKASFEDAGLQCPTLSCTDEPPTPTPSTPTDECDEEEEDDSINITINNEL